MCGAWAIDSDGQPLDREDTLKVAALGGTIGLVGSLPGWAGLLPATFGLPLCAVLKSWYVGEPLIEEGDREVKDWAIASAIGAVIWVLLKALDKTVSAISRQRAGKIDKWATR